MPKIFIVAAAVILASTSLSFAGNDESGDRYDGRGEARATVHAAPVRKVGIMTNTRPRRNHGPYNLADPCWTNSSLGPYYNCRN
jgi:hypothetical protein